MAGARPALVLLVELGTVYLQRGRLGPRLLNRPLLLKKIDLQVLQRFVGLVRVFGFRIYV
jgi:hypothetical protein